MSSWAHAVVLVVLAGVVAAAAEVSYNNNNNDPFGLKCKLLKSSQRFSYYHDAGKRGREYM